MTNHMKNNKLMNLHSGDYVDRQAVGPVGLTTLAGSSDLLAQLLVEPHSLQKQELSIYHLFLYDVSHEQLKIINL